MRSTGKNVSDKLQRSTINTHMSTLQVLCNHVCRLLLIDEYNDWSRETAIIENFNESLPARGLVSNTCKVDETAHFFFSSPLTNSTRCSTVSTARPASPMVIVAAFLRYLRASLSTAGGIVAENNVVTRVRALIFVFPSTSIAFSPFRIVLGSASRINVRSASKPRWTIRSASSMTTYVHWDRTSMCRSMTSFNRPGVAMMISAPSRKLNCCSSTARYKFRSARIRIHLEITNSLLPL